MALALSIALSLIVGISVMFTTKYFWGKESNDNINTLNCTMNNLTSEFGVSGIFSIIIIVVVAIIIVIFRCSFRGF